MSISLNKIKKLRNDYNLEKVNAMSTTSYQFSSSSQSSRSSSFSSTDLNTDNLPDSILKPDESNSMSEDCSENEERLLISDRNIESGQESDVATTDVDETDSSASDVTDRYISANTEESLFEESLDMKFKNSLKWLKLKDEINVGYVKDRH